MTYKNIQFSISTFQSFITLGVLMVFNFLLTVPVLAQQSTSNPINLGISKVSKNGSDEFTRNVGVNDWIYDGELSLNDSIKYGWSGIDLNTRYINSPSQFGGYLKIYLNDDTTEDNLILNYGTSPLPVSKLASKIEVGQNQLLFVYIDNDGDAAAKVRFKFNFTSLVTDPSIEIQSPAPMSPLGIDINQEFNLKLSNFSLESLDTSTSNKGKINLYFNEVNPDNLITTFDRSRSLSDSESELSFNTEDLNLENLEIPDSQNTKFIFVLTKSNGDLLPFRSEINVQTNYENTIDFQFPSIEIIEPSKESSDLQVDGDRKFILDVQNFNILSEKTIGSSSLTEGYLQIFVDGQPYRTVFPNTEFSLNELNINNLEDGKKTIKVQLLTKDYTSFNPEVSDTIDVIYTKAESQVQNTPQASTNNWRPIIVIFTVILVIGGIAILITKG